MKRFNLSLSMASMVIAVAIADSAQAGDKGGKQHGAGNTTAMQGTGIKSGSIKTGISSSNLQNTGIANSLNKQGAKLQQNKLNNATTLQNKQLNSSQLMKKDNGSQGNSQQMAKKQIGSKDKDKHFMGIKDKCYFGKDFKFWTNHCWNPTYGCETYFCSTRNCWYFWYEAYACYLPVEYWATYCEPVVEVAQPVVEVSQPAVEVVQQPVEVVQKVIAVPTVRYVVRPYVYARPFYSPGFVYLHH
jgi:hypothetical protein